MSFESDLYGYVYKSQKTKNAAAKRKSKNEETKQMRQNAYNQAFERDAQTYAKKNNISGYSSADLGEAARAYYGGKKEHQKFLDWSNKESASRNKSELKSYASYAANEDNNSLIDEYNAARKKMGLQADNMPTKKKYDQMFGKEKTGDIGIAARMEQYYAQHPDRKTVQQELNKPFRSSKDIKVNHNGKPLGASFDQKVDKGLNGLASFIDKVKNSKVVQGAEDLAKKIDDNKIGHAYVKTTEELLKHSPVGQKVQGMKTINEAMPLVDQYGGAASTRNVLADVTDGKDQTAKQYIEDIKGGFSGKKNTKGEEIAKNLGVQSKYGGKAAGFGIELLADPTNFIPAGIAGKVLKNGSKLAKLAKEGQVTGEAIKATDLAKIVEKYNKTGKVSKSEAKLLNDSLKKPEVPASVPAEDLSKFPKNFEGLYLIKDDYPMQTKAQLQKMNEAIKNPKAAPEQKAIQTIQENPELNNNLSLVMQDQKQVAPKQFKSLNDLMNSSKVKQAEKEQLITPKEVNQKPVDYAAQKNELSAIHEADRQQFAAQNKDVIEAVSGERQRAVDQFNKEDMEWKGHEAAAKQYDDIMKSVGGRLNIPTNNMNDFASQLSKHMYSAAGKGQGDDIYKVAEDLGFHNPDELVQTLNNGYASKQIIKGGKNRFYSVDGKKLQDPNPEAIIDEMHSQTPSSQQLKADMAKMDQLHNEQSNKVPYNPNDPLAFKRGSDAVNNPELFNHLDLRGETPKQIFDKPGALSENATTHEKIQHAVEQVKNGDDSYFNSLLSHTDEMIKQLEKSHADDEEMNMLKEDFKGLKLNLQTFAGTPKTMTELMQDVERINKQAEKLMKTRKGLDEVKVLTPEEKVDHYIQRHQANVDYLQGKIDEIDNLLNSPVGSKMTGDVLELRNNFDAKLQKANLKLDAAHETKGSIGEIQNKKDVKSILTALIKPMRLFEKAFGKNSDIHLNLTEGMQQARTLHSELDNADYDQIKSIEKLIGKKKRDSALLQDFGEKTLPEKAGIDTANMSKDEIAALNLELLKKKAPATWKNFEQADQLARKYYDSKIEAYNKVMQETYSHDAEKLSQMMINKRQDYYHHFNEMGEGFAAIMNRLKHEKASKISPQLEGLSKFTKPATQWVGQKLARLGGAYTSDAIGGMVKTSQDLNKAIAWTPQIGKLRTYKEVLSTATEHTANLNNVLRVMDNYANKLANKSGDMDRWLGDNALSRAGVGILNATSNIVKNNLLSHSLRVVLAQGLTIPHGFAAAKTENIIKGIPATMDYLFKGGGAASKSPFLKERLGTKKFSDFKHGAIQTFIKTGHAAPELVDKVMSPMIWNGIYHDLLSKNKHLINNGNIPKDLEQSLINEADKLTSEVIGGRGVGDKSFAQESKLYNTLDPFQLEPQSQWLAMGRMFGGLKEGIKNKDLKQIAGSSRRIAEWGVYSYLVGEMFQYATGSDAALNPIEDIKKGYEEGGGPISGSMLAARNIAGDAITSGGIPLVQSIGNLTGLAKNSQKIFGKEDPFRFAQGGILAAKPIDEMINGNGLTENKYLKHLPASIMLPAGKSALERFFKEQRAVKEGGVYNKTHPEKMLYPVGNDFLTRLQGMTMGVNATKNAQKYFKSNGVPMSEKQTLDILKSADPEKKWNDILDKKGSKHKPKTSTLKAQERRIKEIQKLKKQ